MRRIVFMISSLVALAVAAGAVFAGYQLYMQLARQLDSTKTQLALLQRSVGNIENKTASSLTTLQKDSQSLTQKLQQSQTQLDSLALPQNLLDAITARIVWIACQDSNHTNDRSGSGTVGLISSSEKGTPVTTNFHVTGYPTSFCVTRFPVAPGYDKLGPAKTAFVGKYDQNYPDVDVALVQVPDTTEKYGPFPLPFCASSDIKTGNPITLFGYPSFGGNTLTVTNGIVSGVIDTKWGPKYKTSAKIDFGNSGGLAVDNKHRCVIGIPTWTRFGGELGQELSTGESLGQIESWEMIKKSGQVL